MNSINRAYERLDNLLALYNIQATQLRLSEKAVLIRLLNKCDLKIEPKDKQWISRWLVDYHEKWRFDLW